MKKVVSGLVLALVLLALGLRFRGQFFPQADTRLAISDKYLKQAYALPDWWQAEGGVQKIPLPADITPALACTANENPPIRSRLNTETLRRLQALPAPKDPKHPMDLAVAFVDSSGNLVDCAFRAALAKSADYQNQPEANPTPIPTPTPSPTQTPLSRSSLLIPSAQAAEPAYQHKSTDRYLIPKIDACDPITNPDGSKTDRTDCQQWTADELKLLNLYTVKYLTPDPITGQTQFDKINGWPLMAIGGRNLTIIKPTDTPYGRDGYANLSNGIIGLKSIYPHVFIHETFHIHDGATTSFMPNAYVEGNTEKATQMLLAATEGRSPESYAKGIDDYDQFVYQNQPALAFGNFQTDKIGGGYMSYMWGGMQWAELHLVNGLRSDQVAKFRLGVEAEELKMSTSWGELKQCELDDRHSNEAKTMDKPDAWMAASCLSRNPVWLFNKLMPTLGQNQPGAEWWMTHFLMRERGYVNTRQYVLQTVPDVKNGSLTFGLGLSDGYSNSWPSSKLSINSKLIDGTSRTNTLNISGSINYHVNQIVDGWFKKHSVAYTGKIVSLVSATDPLDQVHQKILTQPVFASWPGGIYGSVQPDNIGTLRVETVGDSPKQYSAEVKNGVFQVPELKDYYGELKVSFYNSQHQQIWARTYVKPPGAYAISVVTDEKPTIKAFEVEDTSGHEALVKVDLSRPGNTYISYSSAGGQLHYSDLSVDSANPYIRLGSLTPDANFSFTVYAFDDWGNMTVSNTGEFTTKSPDAELATKVTPIATNLSNSMELVAGQPLKITYSGKLSLNFDPRRVFELYGIRQGQKVPINYRLTINQNGEQSVISIESDENNNTVFGEPVDNFRRYPTYLILPSGGLTDQSGEYIRSLPGENYSLLFDTSNSKTLLLSAFSARDPNLPEATAANSEYLKKYTETNYWSCGEGKAREIALGGGGAGESALDLFPDISRFDVSPVHKNGLIGDGEIDCGDYSAMREATVSGNLGWQTPEIKQLLTQAKTVRDKFNQVSIKAGDLNSDGKVTAADVQLALQIVVGNVQPTDVQARAMDVYPVYWDFGAYGDGRLDFNDATAIQAHLLAKNQSAGWPLIVEARSLPDIIYGDLDGDGKIGQADANLLLTIVTNGVTPTEYQQMAGDVSPVTADGLFGDGSLTVADVQSLAAYVKGENTNKPWPGKKHR